MRDVAVVVGITPKYQECRGIVCVTLVGPAQRYLN
jgi:hypothetical protein